MSENFKTIYKILKILESSMDYPEFDSSRLDAKNSGVTEHRRNALLYMLMNEGYLTGDAWKYADGGYVIEDIGITLKGLEYIETNPIMNQIGKQRDRKTEVHLGYKFLNFMGV